MTDAATETTEPGRPVPRRRWWRWLAAAFLALVAILGAYAEAAGLPNPLLPRMPFVHVFVPGDLHRRDPLPREHLRRGRDRRVAPPEIRDYGIGAQILADLGVRDMVRLSDNPRPIVGLEGYGLRVAETRPLRRGEPA